MEKYTEDYKLELDVLSTIIYESESARRHINLFFPQLFSKPGARAIFKITKQSLLEQKPLDKQYIINTLSSEDDPVLIDLTFGRLSALNTLSETGLVWASERLKKLYFYRVTRKISEKIDEAIAKNKQRRVLELSGEVPRFHGRLFQVETRNFFSSSVDSINDPSEYLSTPYDKINNRIGGWTLNGLSAFGGKSSHNKTTFSVHMLSQAIMLGKVKKGLIVSMDEPGEMIARRIIASQMDISLSDMRFKRIKLSKQDVSDAMKAFEGKLMIVDDIFTPDEIYETVMDIKATQTIVDHIQEPSFGDVGISDPAVTRLLTLLKHSAIKNKNNVFCLSQVRDKQIDERIDKVPRAHDFYYSSTIRQKSREQVVGYWRYMDTKKPKHFNEYEIHVYKSTYSKTGEVIKLYYEPDKARFGDKYHDSSFLEDF